MKALAGYLAIFTGLVAGCGALFLRAEDCALQFGGHGGAGAPFDLLHGVVGTQGGDSPATRDGPGNAFSFLQVKDCDSGKFAQLTYQIQEGYYDSRGAIRYKPGFGSEENYEAFKSRILARQPSQDIEWIVEQANSMGLKVGAYEVVYEDNLSETCGCRVFYPELRGDKKPYMVA